MATFWETRARLRDWLKQSWTEEENEMRHYFKYNCNHQCHFEEGKFDFYQMEWILRPLLSKVAEYFWESGHSHWQAPGVTSYSLAYICRAKTRNSTCICLVLLLLFSQYKSIKHKLGQQECRSFLQRERWHVLLCMMKTMHCKIKTAYI